MPNLRRMSGRAVLAVFESFGFEVQSRKGSHVKLRRIGPHGERQTLTIPDHSELDTGTLRAIVRQATRYISTDDLKPHFYR
ncbi:MAG: type II toxin-antitoxin system HicA family toxin [Candidatus Hydrogenedentes bacterium]|nr:type II toxin-antitoxin system HicA family toxin [Candidatus Hydrogenedentota bacterium]